MSTPFKMKKFSGFGNSSPLHNSEKYVEKQLKKAKRLTKKAEEQEKKAEETRKH